MNRLILITDFQKLSERESEPIISTISKINKNNISTFDFIKCLLNLRILLKKNNFTSIERRNILRDFIRIFLFKKLVLKDNSYENIVKKNQVPKGIIKEIESYINIDKKNVTDEIYRQNNILPKRNSSLDKWIKSEFLKEIKKYFRGVVGYKVHARYAINNKNLKNGKRFEFSFSNFHWDYALNAMPYVIYLSDVKKGDGEFKILKSSINFNQNLYLSSFDYLVSNKNGIQNSIMSNRVGSHLDIKDRKEIENDIRYFEGSKGTSIFFSGRHIIHCGGYPEKGKNRLSVFLSHKNILIAFINNITKIFDLY